LPTREGSAAARRMPLRRVRPRASPAKGARRFGGWQAGPRVSRALCSPRRVADGAGTAQGEHEAGGDGYRTQVVPSRERALDLLVVRERLFQRVDPDLSTYLRNVPG